MTGAGGSPGFFNYVGKTPQIAGITPILIGEGPLNLRSKVLNFVKV